MHLEWFRLCWITYLRVPWDLIYSISNEKKLQQPYTTNPNEHLPSNGRATVEQQPSSKRRAQSSNCRATVKQLLSNRRAIAR